VANETADKNTACLLVPLGSLLKVVPMIDPPSQQPGQPERKVELDQTVDFAVQLLVEEAHLVGWTRIEFLTAIMDAANSRIATIEEERQRERAGPAGSKDDQVP